MIRRVRPSGADPLFFASHYWPPIAGSEQPVERGARRGVGAAVDACGAEMALEGFDHFLEPGAVGGGQLDSIAEALKRLLQLGNRLSLVARAKAGIRARRQRFDPETDAGAGQTLPIEFLAGIAFPARGNVGMRQHAVRRDGMASEDVEAERLDATHLDVGKIRIVEIVAGI